MFRTSKYLWLTGLLFLCLAVTPAISQQRPPFDQLLARAEKALAAGDTAKAIELYEKLVSFYPSSAPAHNRLGFANYKKGNDPRAIFEFRKSLALSRNNPEALHNLILASGRQADTLSRESRFAEAVHNLDELIAEYPWHPQYAALLYYRGRTEFLRGQPEDGLSWWKKAAVAAPDSGVAKVILAQTRPFDEKTIALYREAAQKVRTEPSFDYLLGNRYLQANRPVDALTAFSTGLEKCRKADIPFPLLSLKAAEAALSSNQAAIATTILEEARQQRPDWTSLRTLLWAAYLEAGQADKAKAALQDAFELDGRPKLALLGDATTPVRLSTTGGSLELTAVTAVSPSPGKAKLAVGDKTMDLDIAAGDALVFRLKDGELAMEDQAKLTRQSSAAGALAPPLVAKDRKGQFYRLADALLKRPIVILFWSAQSEESPALLDGLGALQNRYGGKLETVAIHTDPKVQKDAQQLYLSRPGTSAQLWGDSKSGADFGVTASPALVLIDRSGRIVMREASPTVEVFSVLPPTLDGLVEPTP